MVACDDLVDAYRCVAFALDVISQTRARSLRLAVGSRRPMSAAHLVHVPESQMARKKQTRRDQPAGSHAPYWLPVGVVPAPVRAARLAVATDTQVDHGGSLGCDDAAVRTEALSAAARRTGTTKMLSLQAWRA
jgi:hypothetical protein